MMGGGRRIGHSDRCDATPRNPAKPRATPRHPARPAGSDAKSGLSLYAATSPRSRPLSIDPTQDERAALASAWRLQRTGNFVAAFDCAQEALRRFPESQALAYLSVLALASCGSTEAALEAFHATSLSASPHEDFTALEARLLKDLAFSRRADADLLLTQAARAYESAASRTDGTYSLQNAALLWALAGDAPRALRLAGSVARRVTELNVPEAEEAAYFHWATIAEAALVLGDRSLLQSAVLRANPSADRTPGPDREPSCKCGGCVSCVRNAQISSTAGIGHPWDCCFPGSTDGADRSPGSSRRFRSARARLLCRRRCGRRLGDLTVRGIQLHVIYPDARP